MDSSGDSFIVFKHFEYLDINVIETTNELLVEFEKKESFLKSELQPTLNFLNECRNSFIGNDLDCNIPASETKVNASKTDLEVKLMALNELKIKSEMLEAELNDANARIFQNEINDLIKEVLQEEKEKTQRIQMLQDQRDLIISKMFYYKKFLDCYLAFTEPDDYTFYFNQLNKDLSIPDKWIKLRTDDFKCWQIIDATIDSEQLQEVIKLLKESGSIQRVLCRVHNIVKNA